MSEDYNEGEEQEEEDNGWRRVSRTCFDQLLDVASKVSTYKTYFAYFFWMPFVFEEEELEMMEKIEVEKPRFFHGHRSQTSLVSRPCRRSKTVQVRTVPHPLE